MRRLWVNVLIVCTGVLLGLALRQGKAYFLAREGAEDGRPVVAASSMEDNSVWDFEAAEVGQLPKGWAAAKTGVGTGSVWRIQEDTSAPAGSNVLAQVSTEGPNRLFNLCVADDTRHDDLDLRLACKALRGKLDQGGGPVWRYVDSDNYYIARFNPLENNYRLYKVVAGKRIQLASVDAETAANQWYTVRIVHRGTQIQCYLNERLLMEVEDATFREAGKIGLWTKADAVTSFDQLLVVRSADASSVLD